LLVRGKPRRDIISAEAVQELSKQLSEPIPNHAAPAQTLATSLLIAI